MSPAFVKLAPPSEIRRSFSWMQTRHTTLTLPPRRQGSLRRAESAGSRSLSHPMTSWVFDPCELENQPEWKSPPESTGTISDTFDGCLTPSLLTFFRQTQPVAAV